VRRRALACLLCATALPLVAVGRAEAPLRVKPPAGAGVGAARHLPTLPPGALGTGTHARSLRCTRGTPTTALAHLELFAHGHVVIVPAGIGIAPPRRREGAYVRGGACRYPVWSDESTGLLRLARGGLTLGDLFAVWGQPLTRSRLARWSAPVRAHVDGRPWRGDPRGIPLRDHAQIVLQAGGPLLAPNARYEFPAP
jgi:hypothetical protein